MNRKVSFDFDGTLDRPKVQTYAQKLIALGVDVWVCTSRLSDEFAPSPGWNNDLYAVTDSLNIPRTQIHFCCHDHKYKYFQNEKFVWHLDDHAFELSDINRYTKVAGIFVFGNNKWIGKCNKLLGIK
jgi:hypothetical protein